MILKLTNGEGPILVSKAQIMISRLIWLGKTLFKFYSTGKNIFMTTLGTNLSTRET
jgi:hypothetical protein